jgi:hypothetical protein
MVASVHNIYSLKKHVVSTYWYWGKLRGIPALINVKFKKKTETFVSFIKAHLYEAILTFLTPNFDSSLIQPTCDAAIPFLTLESHYSNFTYSVYNHIKISIANTCRKSYGYMLGSARNRNFAFK